MTSPEVIAKYTVLLLCNITPVSFSQFPKKLQEKEATTLHYCYLQIYFLLKLEHPAQGLGQDMKTGCSNSPSWVMVTEKYPLLDSHRDYKRIEAASGDESRDKLNTSNGGGGANISPGCSILVLLAFMTMMYTDIDYNEKICCSFLASFCNLRRGQIFE